LLYWYKKIQILTQLGEQAMARVKEKGSKIRRRGARRGRTRRTRRTRRKKRGAKRQASKARGEKRGKRRRAHRTVSHPQKAMGEKKKKKKKKMKSAQGVRRR
jgi:hypothetical protein